ncbi:hypothetical protein BKA70DRAFT_1229903 [Coprinopsis sp. MPI-PUGE-AT-0042]|nr:hypothetical protein BKA70DRAFT_1229903 [Coprinopsis sp. MPI-PUGE-AT-0042]
MSGRARRHAGAGQKLSKTFPSRRASQGSTKACPSNRADLLLSPPPKGSLLHEGHAAFCGGIWGLWGLLVYRDLAFSLNSSKPSPRAAVRMVSQSDPNSPEPGVIRRILQHFWLLPCLSEVTVRSNPPNLAQS